MTAASQRSTSQQIDALVAKLSTGNPFKFWVEFLLAFYLIAMLLSLTIQCKSRQGMIVLAHSVRKGSVLTKDDLRVASINPLDQSFGSPDRAAGLVMARSMDGGSALRWTDVQRSQAIATTTIGANEIVSDKNSALKLTEYDPLAVCAVPHGRKATRSIPSGATIHADMLLLVPIPTLAVAPVLYGAKSGEVELPLRAIAAGLRAAPPAEITLLIARKGAKPLAIPARLLSIDQSKDPAVIVVAIPLPTASMIVQSTGSEIYLTRPGKG